jgi:nucleoside-diphosphate-sugar epimerase
MKILVTGATGFVGGHLCRALVNSGNEVFALARSEKNFYKKKTAGTPLVGSLQNLKWINALPTDLDAVVHVAALVHTWNPEEFYKTNTEGTSRLFNSLKEHFSSLHFVFVSSLSAAGPSDEEIKDTKDETCKNKPVGHYGKSKLLAEEALKQACPREWRLSIIRPPIVIGPNDPAMAEIFSMVKKGLVLYPGRQGRFKRFSFVSVFDLVQTIQKTLTAKCPTNTIRLYFSSYPIAFTYGELIRTIMKVAEKRKTISLNIPMPAVRILVGANKLAARFFNVKSRLTHDKYVELVPANWTCSSQKSIDELGVSYEWNLESTIRATWNDYLQKMWI